MICAALCFRQGPGGLQVLLIRTGEGRRWTFPKGCSRAGEKPVAAALRALYEDSGWRGEQKGKTEFYCIAPQGLTSFVAFAIAPAGRAGPGSETAVPSWFPLSEAERRLAENRAGPLAQRLCVTLAEAAAVFRCREEPAAARG